MVLIKNSKHAVFLVSFVDILAVSAVAPLINVHLHTSGYSNFASGIVSALYPCAQFIFSPIVGHYSDLYGRGTLLQCCLFMCGLCYSLLGVYDNILWILTFRTLVGIVKHTQLICKAILEDEHPTSFQSDYGKMNGYTAIGFIVGPVIGGHLIDKLAGFYYLSLITGSLFFVNALIAYLFLNDDSYVIRKNKSMSDRAKETNFRRTIFSDIKRIEWTNCWDVFLLKLTTTFAVLSFLMNFSLCVKEKYRVDSVLVGYLHSFRGVVGACTGLSVNVWSKVIPPVWNNYRRLKMTFILLAVTSLVQYFTVDMYLFVLSLIPYSMCAMFVRVYSNALLFEKTSDENRGLLLGTFNNVSSMTRFAMPLLVGAFLDAYGYNSIYLLSLLGYLCSAAIVQFRQNSVHFKTN